MNKKICIDCASCEEFYHNKNDKCACFKKEKEVNPYDFCEDFKKDEFLASIED